MLETLWGLWAWAMFLIAVVFSLIVVTIVPGQERRRRLVHLAARFAFVAAGARVEVEGLDRLPAGHCVVVANHASYVDGPLLKGYLPPRFSFVIKGEMRDIPVAHFLLRRAGSRFVERFTQAGSARDARHIVKAAQGGQSLGFFPEGTFLEEPGIGRFRGGAFAAAIKGEMPIVPVAISGTRAMMPSGRMLPRPARVRVQVLPAIEPGHPAFENNRALAEEARQRIIAVHDEPDLLL
ncbi:MAG: lysophospholipid acyltransferase family protein [Woeseiaceae bacterium]|nr:lysophospholipid acyltransferase family protein [Woeseiaceae bacterium]